jgi:hypothetical protein
MVVDVERSVAPMVDEHRLPTKVDERRGPTTRPPPSVVEARPATVSDELRSVVRLPPVADGVKPAATVADGSGPAAMVNDEFRLRASYGSQPQSRMVMTDGERPAVTVDELRSMMRLPPMADGVEPAAMAGDDSRSTMTRPVVTVADGEKPAASDEFRLRASDGSQPQSRRKATGGERPAAMVTGGERLAATVDDGLRSTVRLSQVADGV